MLLRGSHHNLKETMVRLTASLMFGLICVLGIFSLTTAILRGGWPFELRAATGINKQINYQGKLTDQLGALLTGTYNIKFVIYDAATGGNCLWAARGACGAVTARSVSVSSGIFNVMLGDTTAGDNAITLDFASDSYYLGVTVESDAEISPRRRIGAAGYAFNADTLDGLNTSNAGGSGAYVPVTDASGNLTITGKIGSGTSTIVGRFSVDTADAATKGIVIRRVASQTANLMEWQNETATILGYIDASGNIGTSGTVYSTSVGTSTFSGGLSVNVLNVSSASATSTFANGIQLNGGCFRMPDGTCAGAGGANTSLSNLSGVAINTSLLSDTNNTDDLGSPTKSWKDIYASGTAYVVKTSAAPLSYGVYADAGGVGGGGNAYGVYAYGHDYAGISYGIYAKASSAYSSTNYAGYFADGDVYIENNLTMGSSSLATITTNGRFASSLVPSTNGDRHLGAYGNAWGNIYASGSWYGNLKSGVNNGLDLGTFSAAWKDVYASGTAYINNTTISGSATSTFGAGIQASHLYTTGGLTVVGGLILPAGSITGTHILDGTVKRIDTATNFLTAGSGIGVTYDDNSWTISASGLGGIASAGGWTTDSIGSVTLSTSTDRVGIGTAVASNAKLYIYSGAAATTSLRVKGFAGQAANITEWVDSSNNVLSYINPSGSFGTSGTLSVDNTLTARGNITLGDASADVLTVNALSKFVANLQASSTVLFDGPITIYGNSTLGDATGDTITVAGRFSSSLNPSSNNQYDIGLFGKAWKNIYASGTIYGGTGSYTISDASLYHGGYLTISGASTSTFTGGIQASHLYTTGGLTVAGGLILPNDSITNAMVSDTLTIGASGSVDDAALSSNVAHLNVAETIGANWVNTANPWADNEIADDITASNYIEKATTTLNGMSIGASTASTGKFTTLQSTGVFTPTGGIATSTLDNVVIGQSTKANAWFNALYASTTFQATGATRLYNTLTVDGLFTPSGGISTSTLNGMSIGGSTPSSGAFTTLSSTGITALGNNSASIAVDSNTWDISIAGVATGLSITTSTLDNISIGASTASTGRFTTLTVTGSATSTFTGGIQATALNITSTSATSTFANGIQLNGGCFRDAGGNCVVSAGSGYANTALSNLSGVAINTSLLPNTANSIDLGSYSKTWKNIYASGTIYGGTGSYTISDASLYHGGYLTISGASTSTFTGGIQASHLYTTGGLTVAGGLILPNDSITNAMVSDTLTIGVSGSVDDAALSSNVAHLNVAETIGANWVNTANPWADNEIADDITASNYIEKATTTLNGMSIGASTPSTGKFTTLQSTGVFTPTGGIATSTLDNVVIGQSTKANAWFNALYASTTFQATGATRLYNTLTVDGPFTPSGGISTSTLNGMSIGGSTPSSGAFTTLSSTGITALGNNSASIAVDSNTWDISIAGVASGLSITTSTLDNISIGASTASTGRFTTLTVTGSATSTFTGGIQATALNITSTSATSTFANGIQLNGGCFRDAGGNCVVSAGSGYANTALSNLSGVAINTSLLSDANNTDDLGAYGKAWKNIYASDTVYVVTTTADALSYGVYADSGGVGGGGFSYGVYAYGHDFAGINYGIYAKANSSFGGTNYAGYFADGNVYIENDLTMGNSSSDNITVNGRLASSLTPNADNSFDLGAYGYAWKDVYASGTIYASSTQFSSGTAGSPSITFQGDPDTGFYLSASNAIGFVTGGVERLRLGLSATADYELKPITNNNTSLGAYGNAWKNIYASGTAVLGGSVQLGSSQNDLIGVNGVFANSLIAWNSGRNLGAQGQPWGNIYTSGSLYLGALATIGDASNSTVLQSSITDVAGQSMLTLYRANTLTSANLFSINAGGDRYVIRYTDAAGTIQKSFSTSTFQSVPTNAAGYAGFIFDSLTTLSTGSDDRYVVSFRNNGTKLASLSAEGNWRILGTLYAVSNIVGTPGNPGDLAENVDIKPSENVEPGDVIIVSNFATETTMGWGFYEKSKQSYETKIAGVVSTRPTITMGYTLTENKALLAIGGQVPVKVTNENGAIEAGDLLVTSSKPGYAMKFDSNNTTTDAVVGVVGVALESFDGEEGKILVLLKSGYLGGVSSLENLGVKQSGDGLLVTDGNLDMKGYDVLNVKNMVSSSGNWSIAENGNIITKGKIINKVKTSKGERDLFALTSPKEEMVLSGVAQLASGEARIIFEEDLQEIIATSTPIKVTVTLTSEANGLFVFEKSENGFRVKELGGGQSSAAFDWIVVAQKIDASALSGVGEVGDERGVETASTIDVDNDGYPVCSQPPTTNHQPTTTCDCVDNDASVYPGREEICGNMADDNCDGVVDEGCSSPISPISPISPTEEETPPADETQPADEESGVEIEITPPAEGELVSLEPSEGGEVTSVLPSDDGGL